MSSLADGTVKGFVLIGGRSRRMGRHKALIDMNGMPAVRMITRSLLEGGCSEAICVAPTDAPAELRDLASVFDPGDGPMGAVLSALESSTSEWSFVIAVDHLGFGPADVARLIASARSDTTGTDVLCAVDDSQRQPLISIWRTRSCRAKLRSMFDAGIRSFDEALGLMVWSGIEFGPRSTLNVNTPADLLDFKRSQ